MTFNELKELLWRTGHFRNPGKPNVFDVKKEDLPKLKRGDKAYIEAVQSYQQYFGPILNELVYAIHKRPLQVDGKPGPATQILIESPRCMHPDFDVPDDPEITVLWAREDANWPDNCRDNLITGRSFESLPGLDKEKTDAIWWGACNNWTAAISVLQMTPAPVGQRDGTHFYAGMESMSGGTLAWSYLARNSCSVNLAQAYNSQVNWNPRMATTVKTHEDGHALGLNHVNQSQATMYPSIHQHSLARFGYPNSADIQAMERLGYAPYGDWDQRKPPEDRLFSPRGGEDRPVGYDWLEEWWLK